MSFLKFIQSFFNKKQEIEDPMKYLIVGLGNIGEKYDGTRHNIGFEAVDFVAHQFDAKFSTEKLGDIAEFRHKGRTFILLKPSTYMNLSGKSVRYWMQTKKINDENLLVILDDLNLSFGTIRLRGKGSPGGHNGLKDIDAVLGRSNYPRLRIGIGGGFSKGHQVDYVLGKWKPNEAKELPELMDIVKEAVLGFGTIGLSRTMNTVNKKRL